jgi:hypothetical protein
MTDQPRPRFERGFAFLGSREGRPARKSLPVMNQNKRHAVCCVSPVTDPRGKYLGARLGEGPAGEAEHFISCPACGGWIDCRDLGQVFEHDGPLPHPAQDQPQ